MERGLRDCCRSIRIGKILIRRDPDTKHAKVREWVGLVDKVGGATSIYNQVIMFDSCTSMSAHQLVCVCVLSLQVYYAKFPPNIDEGTILLLYPVLGES